MTASARRLTPLIGAALLGGCVFFGSSERPHSDYFILEFLSGTPALSQPGLEALDQAVHQAARALPTEIVIEGAAPPDAAEPFAAFAKADIDTRRIRVELRPSTEQGFAERKDSLILQLAYREPPPR
jgi:hypothetical protein